MHKSVHNSSVLDSYHSIIIYCLSYLNVLCSHVLCMYACMHQELLKKTQQIPCVCAHLANKANSDSKCRRNKHAQFKMQYHQIYINWYNKFKYFPITSIFCIPSLGLYVCVFCSQALYGLRLRRCGTEVLMCMSMTGGTWWTLPWILSIWPLYL